MSGTSGDASDLTPEDRAQLVGMLRTAATIRGVRIVTAVWLVGVADDLDLMVPVNEDELTRARLAARLILED